MAETWGVVSASGSVSSMKSIEFPVFSLLNREMAPESSYRMTASRITESFSNPGAGMAQ
jgi:hypothetical protein